MQLSFIHFDNSIINPFLEIIDGNWGQWGIWSRCNKPCDGGTQTRTRLCDDPKVENGGDNCPSNDSYVETAHATGIQQQKANQTCNNHPCPGKQVQTIFWPINIV